MYPKFPKVKGVRFAHIPDFPGYCVGTDGSVWSCYVRGSSTRRLDNTWRVLQVSTARNGAHSYATCTLCRRGFRRTKLVHVLVLSAFVGKCPTGMEGAHQNGVRDDNRLENLRWKTRKDNQRDRVRHGTHLEGDKHPLSILTSVEVLEIVKRLDSGEIHRTIAVDYGVSTSAIDAISVGQTWRHLTKRRKRG